MPSDLTVETVARLRLKDRRDDTLVLAVPGTDYELHLQCENAEHLTVGGVVRGELHAQALRMHQADAGGQFIEPVYGTPRIVQGFVQHVDPDNNRVLMHMPVPVWVTLHEHNDINAFQPGDMWNTYVESGMRFVPAM